MYFVFQSTFKQIIMNNNNTKHQQPWLSSNIIKLGLITVMGLLLLIPLSMIKSVIREREATEKEVDLRMMEQWGGPQTITGPIVNIPIYYFSYNLETGFNA